VLNTQDMVLGMFRNSSPEYVEIIISVPLKFQNTQYYLSSNSNYADVSWDESRFKCYPSGYPARMRKKPSFTSEQIMADLREWVEDRWGCFCQN